MKNKLIRLTEGDLHRIVKSSVKMAIQEKVNYKKGLQFINEGMVMPYTIERVWVSKENDDCFVVKGGDGEYYDVYPNYHDSYKVDNQGDVVVQKIGKKVEQAFRNHNINAHCFNYDDYLIIEVDFNGGYNGEYDKPLKSWLEKNGFTFDRFDDMYNQYWYKYNNTNTEPTEEFMSRLSTKYEDITNIMRPYMRNGGIDFGRNLIRLYKQAVNGGGIKPGIEL